MNLEQTKAELLKILSVDDAAIDGLLEKLSVMAELFSTENTGDYGLPIDNAAGKEVMRMIVLSWFTKL